MGYVLDTDHFTLLERGDAVVTAKVMQHPPDEVAISIVTVEESLRGRLAVIARASTGVGRIRGYREFQDSIELIGRLHILGFTEAAEGIYLASVALKLQVGTNDLKIASVAQANSLVVVTRNRRDFGRVPGLAIEDWSGG